ncbi:unnamed protein product [Discosporangium mesarthrocarpum]
MAINGIGPGATSIEVTEFQVFMKNREQVLPVLDLRQVDAFASGHLIGSTSIPIDELLPRLLELPPPFGLPVSTVGNAEDLAKAREFLEEKGWSIGEEILVEGQAWFGTRRIEAGLSSVQVWRANAFLTFCMEHFFFPLGTGNTPLAGTALDLGCGSGRDTVSMAQHLPCGWDVVGIDNHSKALERGSMLALQWTPGGSSNSPEAGAYPTCRWVLADLRKDGCLKGMHAHIVHGHRFKCENLWSVLRDEVLLPGGLFIWSTFVNIGVPNHVPPWRPSRMVRPNELRDLFSGPDFDILYDEVGELPTRGSSVPAKFFACRKKSSVVPP